MVAGKEHADEAEGNIEPRQRADGPIEHGEGEEVPKEMRAAQDVEGDEHQEQRHGVRKEHVDVAQEPEEQGCGHQPYEHHGGAERPRHCRHDSHEQQGQKQGAEPRQGVARHDGLGEPVGKAASDAEALCEVGAREEEQLVLLVKVEQLRMPKPPEQEHEDADEHRDHYPAVGRALSVKLLYFHSA